MHRSHIDSQAAKMTLGEALTSQLRKLPSGPNYFGTRGITVEHDRRKINEARKQREEMKAMTGAGPIVFTVPCGCGKPFKVEFADIKALFEASPFVCPSCGLATYAEQGINPADVKMKD